MTSPILKSEKIISTTKYGLSTLKIVRENSIEISNFDYSPAFTDELKKLGGSNEKDRFVFVFPNDKNVDLRINEICTYYWCNGRTMTDGQRALRDKIIAYFENPDMTFKKDNYGLAFYDLNEISGTPTEIKKELVKGGFKVKQIRGRRIYVIN